MDRYRRALAINVILTVVYVVSGKLALQLAFFHSSATAVWPNSGIALVALLILGNRVLPAVFLGAFLVNFTTTGYWGTSLGIAAGNTMEAALGAWLVSRFAGGSRAMSRTMDIVKFSVLAAGLSTMVAATIGTASLTYGGLAAPSDIPTVWLTWWLGDAVGDIIVAPMVLLWVSDRGNPWKWSRVRPEAIGLLSSVVLMGQIVFNGLIIGNYPIGYLCIPFLAWAAFRFGQREASVTVFIFAVSAIMGTLSGFGPFGETYKNNSLILLQTFLGVCGLLSLILSTEISERRRAEGEAMHLAAKDPLTGLGNYRRLMNCLSQELERAGRTGRPFSLVLLDVDGLKKINDVYGHVAGSQALVRVASILSSHCRSTDAPTRFGGDEFVVVLPETRRPQAQALLDRIHAELEASEERPRLSVSSGMSEHPHDGQTTEELLRAADRNLYVMKHRNAGRYANGGGPMVRE